MRTRRPQEEPLDHFLTILWYAYKVLNGGLPGSKVPEKRDGKAAECIVEVLSGLA